MTPARLSSTAQPTASEAAAAWTVATSALAGGR